MVDQIRCIGKDPALLAETLAVARSEAKARIKELEVEKRSLGRGLARHSTKLQELVGNLAGGEVTTAQMADLQERIQSAEQRTSQIRAELIGLERQLIDENEAMRVMAAFDPVWETLSLREQARVLRLLIQRVDYDGDKGTVSVTFHPSGIEMLSHEVAEETA